MSKSGITPDTCGCCEGIKTLTPETLKNRPGLSALAYRIGTHGSFKKSIQAMLTKFPALRKLTTRSDDDPSIALLDGWATVLDVLTFYQERIANEGYLRTATERRSLLELARSIGYELRPGVAAGTYLAFVLDDKEGSPEQVTIEAGTKAQSVPGQDELPQIFETVEKIEARAEWNELRPKQVEKRFPSEDDTYMYLKGITANLKPGDPFLIVGEKRGEKPESERWEFRKIRELKIDVDNDRTRISWYKPLGNKIPRILPPDMEPKVYAFRLRAAIFGHNAPAWEALPISLRFGDKNQDPNDNTFKPGAYAGKENDWVHTKFKENTKVINLDSVYSQITFNSWIVLSSIDYAAELYRVQEIDEETKADYNITAKTSRLRISGENIEKFSPRSATVFAQSEQIDIADTPLLTPVFGNKIKLEKEITGLENGRTLVINGNILKYVTVTERMHVYPRKNRLGTDWNPLFLELDDGSQHIELKSDEQLEVLGITEEDEVKEEIKWCVRNKDGVSGYVKAGPGDLVPGPEPEENGPAGPKTASEDDEDVISEVVKLDRVEREGEFSVLVLESNLKYVYKRDSVKINANAAPATHGETKTEVLGSGDGSKIFQKFVLKQKPLTHVSAPTPGGSESTLEIRVNDILWEEVPSFYQLSPEKRGYIARADDYGNVTVQFGDGITGARLPTGPDNVTARYRVGTGFNGLVDTGQISMLMSKPLGVKSVTNPMGSSGADGPEERDQARRNAPLTVLTMDRIVSLRDFEDFACAFPGIGKARADLLWSGQEQLVHITVSAADGGEVGEDSALYENLLKGIDAARHSDRNIKINSYVPLFFNVEAGVIVDSACITGNVLAGVSEALLEAFAFERRSLGAGITASDIFAVMQRVKGVVAVDIEKLELKNGVAGNNIRPIPFLRKKLLRRRPPLFPRPAAGIMPGMGKVDMSGRVLKQAGANLKLPARCAWWDEKNKVVHPAELLVINPEGIKLTEKTV